MIKMTVFGPIVCIGRIWAWAVVDQGIQRVRERIYWADPAHLTQGEGSIQGSVDYYQPRKIHFVIGALAYVALRNWLIGPTGTGTIFWGYAN